MWNRSEDKVTLALIRHGATNANRQRRYLGRTDEPLSGEGRRQLLKYQGKGYYPKAGHVFASPMLRCRQTAALLYPGQEPVLVPEWTEMDFGAFEGKNAEELEGDPRYREWIDSNGRLPFPEGEGREAFLLRCRQGFERLFVGMEQSAGIKKQEWPESGHRKNTEGVDAALIVHGGTIMALLSTYGGGDYFDYQAKNGTGYLCTWESGRRMAVVQRFPALSGREAEE